jgi:hypothetical protein
MSTFILLCCEMFYFIRVLLEHSKDETLKMSLVLNKNHAIAGVWWSGDKSPRIFSLSTRC